MKTEIVSVTPVMAREWLKHNVKNRKLRPGVVETLHHAWSRGEWKVTHQGIAFGKSGNLLDGQHRLTFISQLPDGASVPVNVTTNQDDSTFDAIDQGFRRTSSDVLGVSADLAAAGRFFARVYNGNQATGITVQFLAPFIEWITPEYEALISFCPMKKLVWGSAAVRAAAIYNMKTGHDQDFVKLAYHSLVHADFENMPHAVRALTQQYLSGKIVSARNFDLFCRCIRAFDSVQTGRISKILIRDQAATLEDVRAFLIQAMKQQKQQKRLKRAA